jgi:hypothetical protein
MARDQHTVARYLGCLRAGPRFNGLVKPSSFPPLGIQPSQMKGSFRGSGRGFSGLVGRHEQPLTMHRARSMELPLLGIRAIAKELSVAYPPLPLSCRPRQLLPKLGARRRWPH